MTTIELSYLIATDAQRAELAAGRPAHASRKIALAPDATLAAMASIASDGTATIDAYSTMRLDVPGTYVTRQFVAPRALVDETDALVWLLMERPAQIAAATAEVAAQEAERLARLEADRVAREAELAPIRARAAALAATDPALATDATIRDARQTILGRLSHDETATLRAWIVLADAAVKARAAAVAETIEVAVRAWLREYSGSRVAIDGPELARAAREGRKVRAALEGVVDKRIEAALASVPDAWFAQTYGSEPREGVPAREAYALLDALTAAVPSLIEAAALPGAKVTIGPIARLDVAEKGAAVYRTGCVATLSHPWLDGGESTWSVLAEDPAIESDD